MPCLLCSLNHLGKRLIHSSCFHSTFSSLYSIFSLNSFHQLHRTMFPPFPTSLCQSMRTVAASSCSQWLCTVTRSPNFSSSPSPFQALWLAMFTVSFLSASTNTTVICRTNRSTSSPLPLSWYKAVVSSLEDWCWLCSQARWRKLCSSIWLTAYCSWVAWSWCGKALNCKRSGCYSWLPSLLGLLTALALHLPLLLVESGINRELVCSTSDNPSQLLSFLLCTSF